MNDWTQTVVAAARDAGSGLATTGRLLGLWAAVFGFGLGIAALASAGDAAANSGAPAPVLARCQGCIRRASSVAVIDVQSTHYGLEAVQRSFDRRIAKCYVATGWHPQNETELGYVVRYDAASGIVADIKPSTVGPQVNPALLGCLKTSLTGIFIGRVIPDGELTGFSMTVRATS